MDWATGAQPCDRATGARPSGGFGRMEPDDGEVREWADQTVAFVLRFVAGLAQAPAAYEPAAPQLWARLRQAPPRTPGDLRELLEVLGQAVSMGAEMAGPRMMGFVPGGGLVSAALAEFLASAVNRHTGLAGHAPGAVALEQGVLRWLCDLFELPSAAAGVTCSGASMAALSAVVAARTRHLDPRETARGTLYLTACAHRSIAKAASIAGLHPGQVRTVPVDADLRMDVEAARALIDTDRKAGLRPFCVIATAGSSDTGSIDPLADIAALARQEGMWLHADAAYGGFFQLTDRGRARLAGIERADSIALDPHKSLFLPFGTGVLLVRDRGDLRAAFVLDDTPYLQDVDKDTALPDFADLGPELTRPFRGLRLWLPLHLHGTAAFREALDERLDLAARAHAALAAEPRITVPWTPDLTTVAFRLRDRDENAHARFVDRVNATGRVFLSSTRVAGHHTVRLCVLSHRTRAEHVRQALDAISDCL
ncbi:aminotransferase class V-fold PLP-dependent enzyme [Streptomyces sp. NPDC003077]|uniref:pyridoxal phosphate-dependent decarboxylase family protein n=1 Tax=Streptomyces sp. NPDC003077 TaxID=3154443 RepID=UPI0033B75F26